MKRIDRYVLNELAGPFIFGVAAFASIMIGSSLLFKIATYITDYNMPADLAGRIFLLELPGVIVLTFPMATLLSTLLAFGRMSGSSEIIAYRAGGVSFFRMVIPVLVVGILVSGITIYVNERVVPFTSFETRRLVYEFRYNRTLPTTQYYLNYTPIERESGMPDYFLYAKRFEGKNNTLSQVLYQDFDGGKLTVSIEAESAKWLDEQWVFFKGKTYVYPEGTEPVLRGEFSKYEMKTIKETPRQLSKGSKTIDEMSATELKEVIERYRESGKETNKLLVKYHQRFAIPLSCFIFAMIGAPLGLQPNRSGSSIGLGISILVIFVYYIVLTIGGSLGQAGVLPPLVGAWMPNVLFGLVGVSFNYRASN